MAVTIPDLDEWFDDKDGFPRPNWGAIKGWLRVFVPETERNAAWAEWTRHWLRRLRDALGGSYAVHESENFGFLSEESAEAAARSLAFFERARSHLGKVLGHVALAHARIDVKYLLFRFTEGNDYYDYLAPFHPDGESAGSAGMFIRDGYLHTAYRESWSVESERQVVVHELTHNLLAFLPLPAWLNEAVAMLFDAELSGDRFGGLTRELVVQHREYWNSKTIQEFWRGESFGKVDSQELAYSLSRILLNLIQQDLHPSPEEFRHFVLRADWGDAGAIAAREHLGMDLGEIASIFLGPGEWAPRAKLWRKG